MSGIQIHKGKLVQYKKEKMNCLKIGAKEFAEHDDWD